MVSDEDIIAKITVEGLLHYDIRWSMSQYFLQQFLAGFGFVGKGMVIFVEKYLDMKMFFQQIWILVVV